jgi:hypothetical protein
MFTEDLIGRIDRRLTELANEQTQLQAAKKALGTHNKPATPPKAATPKASSAGRPRARTQRPRGQAGRLVLEALADGAARTATELSNLTKLPVHTVNAEIAKHRKSGAILKAERGYTAAAR